MNCPATYTPGALLLAQLAFHSGCSDGASSADEEQRGTEPAPGFFSRAPDGGGDATPPVEVADEAVVLAEFATESGSTIRFVDESPSSGGSIAVIEVGKHLLLPTFVVEDATALEVFSALAPSDAPTPQRLLADHARLESQGDAEATPREFVTPRVYPIEEEDTWGEHCENAGWQNGFNTWSAAAPAPQVAHILDFVDEYTEYGNLSIYRKIWAGACYKDSGPANSLAVWMENYYSSAWHVSASTRMYIEEADRYLYYSFASICVNPRRIGSHDYAGAGDVWHLSGAWDVYDDCDI